MDVPTLDDNLTTIKKFIREATDWANTIIRVERHRLESERERLKEKKEKLEKAGKREEAEKVDLEPKGRIEFFDEEVFTLEEYSGVSMRKGLLGLGLRKRKDELVEQAEALAEFIQYADPFEVEHEKTTKFNNAYRTFTTNNANVTEEEYQKIVTVLGNMDMSQWGYEDRKKTQTTSANDNLIGNVTNIILNNETLTVHELIKIILDIEEKTTGGTQEDMITKLTERVQDYLANKK